MPLNLDKILKASSFASEKHNNQFRKGTDIPYISHPIDVALKLRCLCDITDVVCAGYLHDTLEDTDTTRDEIAEIFGENVLNLVLSNTEDKSKSWEERKQHTLDKIQSLSYEESCLLLADKYSNLLSLAWDYDTYGDAIWSRFNRGKVSQRWYYTSIYKAFRERDFDLALKSQGIKEASYSVFQEYLKDYFLKLIHVFYEV